MPQYEIVPLQSWWLDILMYIVHLWFDATIRDRTSAIIVLRYTNVYSTSMVRGHKSRSYLCKSRLIITLMENMCLPPTGAWKFNYAPIYGIMTDRQTNQPMDRPCQREVTLQSTTILLSLYKTWPLFSSFSMWVRDIVIYTGGVSLKKLQTRENSIPFYSHIWIVRPA